MDNEKIALTREQLDRLLAAQDKMIRRGIDASTCGTRYDLDRAHEAESAYDDLREELGIA
jgi:hypothetical protein